VLRLESLLNKVTALTLNDTLRQMLGAQENRLDFGSLMDAGTSLIVNLGNCDQETRHLLGSLLVVQLEQAALARIRQPEGSRPSWFCVLDEFQRFVAHEGSAQVLAQMLSEVRKMGLRLILAHQGWYQLGSGRLQGALEQAQLKVIFGSGAETARVVADDLFAPDPSRIKHNVRDREAQDRTHPHFENLLEQRQLFEQQIRTQPRRHILVRPPEREALIPLRTLTLPAMDIPPNALERVKKGLLRQSGERCVVSQSVAAKKGGGAAYPQASGVIKQA
jgi:hypothetical protein